MIQHITRWADTCQIKSVIKERITEAEVMAFEEKKYLTVAVGKAMKVNLNWNGQCYEGRAAGMDFESNGPKKITSTTGR